MLVYVNSKRFKHTLSLDMLFDLEQLEERKNSQFEENEMGS